MVEFKSCGPVIRPLLKLGPDFIQKSGYSDVGDKVMLVTL